MSAPYTLYCAILFLLLGASVLLINSFVAELRQRRVVAGAFSRAFLRGAGIHFAVQGIERLPHRPCVVVANHASYIDGVVAAAALPPDFAFVIKKEMVKVPLAGMLLRRLGSEFVERHDSRRSVVDARRVVKLATTGQSLVFFPEGTFDHRRQVGRFMRGAFAAAQRADMPVVAVAIHGTREVMPPGRLVFCRRPILVQVLEVLPAGEARSLSRELIAKAVGEPLAS